MQTVAAALIERIEAAFRNAVFPAGARMSRPTYDDEGTTEYFEGKTWHGHTAKKLRKLDLSLTVFTVEAFVYYVPAYMLADIKEPEDADSISEALLFWLTPVGTATERAKEIVRRLTKEQRSAVAAYFEYVRERDGECIEGEFRTALELLWSEQA
jgi:hypothetical protein